ncbi:hypothetical protein NMY22_g15570 [Coprinellus aureogranulatus]|nr:hypothetical protein NMY22_g15570 [Coprinellus aureogranulatus]
MQLELDRITQDDLTLGEQSEQKLYQSLLSLSPGLEERLNTGSDSDIHYVAEMITKGISSARSDDTKTLKAAIIETRITPTNQYLSSSLTAETSRVTEDFTTPGLGSCCVRIRRNLRSGTLIPSGDLWPRFLYKDYAYNPKDPWDGLLRSSLLLKAYKHIFTSPSSVDGHAEKATRSSNARIHGMTSVSIASLAYIATQVRFALSSSSIFSRSDTVTDSEFFYNLMIDLLEDVDERVETVELIQWWNRQVFPTRVNHARPVKEESVIAKIKERRRLINEGLWDPASNGVLFAKNQAPGAVSEGSNNPGDSRSC